MAGCATRHHTWRTNPPTPGTRCVGRGVTGAGCDAVFMGAGRASMLPSAPARDADAPPTDAPGSPGEGAAPAPRPGFGAALAVARGAAAPGAAPAAAPAAPPAPVEPPPPKGWHKSAARRVTSLFIAATDKVIEKRGREPVETPDDDPDRLEMAAELSAQFAIWFPDTALPPWGRACIVAAGIASDKWITAEPIEEKPPAVAPVPAPVPVRAAVTTAPAPRPVTEKPLAASGPEILQGGS